LLAKDLIGLNSERADWTNLVRPLSTVGLDDNIEATLVNFQRRGTTMCVVTDHGSPVGIVTVEDILEQVIGRIEDEYPRHPRTALHELILTDSALLKLSSQTADQVIEEMAARVPADRVPAHADIAGLAIEREREISTNVGAGVAIPHARCPGLVSPLVVFGRSLEGVQFGGSSPERVYLLFLLITPAEQPDIQVGLLSQIARVAGSPEVLQRLRDSSTAGDVATALADADVHDSDVKEGTVPI
jgi:mannitol/fructose-specific phosphotransferase system IIA component (Ntr-type)